MAFEKLFSSFQVRDLTLKNRIIFPAMGTKMATEDKFMTQQIIDYHVARVKGGCGLNFTEVCSVYAPASPKKFLSIGSDEFIPGLKSLTDAIHEADGKAGIQLWLGGLAVASDPEAMIIIPSDLAVNDGHHIIPGASLEVIHESIKAFGEAAKRAVLAGFDAIEFHAGHNYVPHSFLSPYFNKREDHYGGSLENRARYSIECIKSIRANIPEGMPLFMRIVAHDDYLDGGLTLEDTIQFCNMAKEAGVDVLDVSRGNFSSAAIKYEVPPVDLAKGFNVENAHKIKLATQMLTVAVGRINDPEQAENIIVNKKADFVVMGRAQLADPEFCNKAKDGNTDSIIKCVACNQGCFDGFTATDVPFITCLRNPALGRESEYTLSQCEHPKKVLIAGGGIAGLEAAMVLKQRGHYPIVCESSNALGGQFALAGAAPRKEEMKEAALSKGRQVLDAGIEVKFNTQVTPELIETISPDELIIAIGSAPMSLNVPGGDHPRVKNSHDILAGLEQVNGHVIVIGGGLVGLEVAEYLHDKVDKITVVEMFEQVAKDLGQLRSICVMENLYASSIETITNAKCIRIEDYAVVIEKNGETKSLTCDSVVVAIGARSRSSEVLISLCIDNGIPYHIIGDAFKARRALNAVSEAYEIAMNL